MLTAYKIGLLISWLKGYLYGFDTYLYEIRSGNVPPSNCFCILLVRYLYSCCMLSEHSRYGLDTVERATYD